MFKPEKMALVTFAGPKSVMEPVVRSLYDLKLLHIEEGALGASKEEGFDIGAPMAGSPEVSETLVRTRSLLSRLGIGKREAYSARIESPPVAAKKISAMEVRILDISEKVKKADDAISRLSAYRSELEPLAAIGALDVSSYAEYKTLAVFVGFVSKTGCLREKIGIAAKNSDIHFAEFHKKPIIALFCDAGSKDAVQKVLSEHGFSEINTKNARALRGAPAKLMKGIDTKLSELESEKAGLGRELARLGDEFAGYLSAHAGHYEAESEKLGAPLKFAASKNAFIAAGWIPEKRYTELESALGRAAGDKIYLARKEVEDEENAPVALSNPRPVKPYEFFLDLYSLPKYTEIDPTFFMFLTFPLFFGFMLGDIGYGLVTLALFTILKSRMPAQRNLLTVMSFSSIAAIIFGLAYGEFFGLEKLGAYELPHILNRVEGATELFMAAVGVGVVHVNIGLLAGFYNVLRMHGLKHAVLEKASWIVLEAGAAIAAAAKLGYAAVPASAGYALALAGILMLVKAEGIKGVLELPSIVANILSYARLMAVGLVSVILALVVNENAGELMHAGPLGIAAAVVILVFGHGINIALGLLSPFIHSMRLHYVEFFLKFYHGGGKRYMPFGVKK